MEPNKLKPAKVNDIWNIAYSRQWKVLAFTISSAKLSPSSDEDETPTRTRLVTATVPHESRISILLSIPYAATLFVENVYYILEISMKPVFLK